MRPVLNTLSPLSFASVQAKPSSPRSAIGITAARYARVVRSDTSVSPASNAPPV